MNIIAEDAQFERKENTRDGNDLMSMIPLPDGYENQNGKLYQVKTGKAGSRTQCIANGIFQVKECIAYDNAPEDVYLGVEFYLDDGSMFYKKIPVSDLRKTTVLKYVPDLFVFMVSASVERECFVQILNYQRAEFAAPVLVAHTCPGYNFTSDGKLFYRLGEKSLNAPENLRIEEPSPYLLLGCRTEEQYRPQYLSTCKLGNITWIDLFCGQGKAQKALFLSTITAYIRPVLQAVGIRDHFAPYIVGESGYGKSEFAKLLTRIFDEPQIISLSSEKEDILRQMMKFRDVPFVVDDLNASGSVAINHQKYARLSEIIQAVSGGGDIRIRNEVFNLQAITPIITAETVLHGHSSVNRTLLIEFSSPFDAEALTVLQENQEEYRSFLFSFITWVCKNFKQLCKATKEWIEDGHVVSAERVIEHQASELVGFTRLNRTYMLLQLALKIFQQYEVDMGVLNLKCASGMEEIFMEAVDHAIDFTADHLKRENRETGTDYLSCLLEMFRFTPKKLVAKNFDQYKKWRKNGYDTVFFSRKNSVCFRAEVLAKYMQDSGIVENSSKKELISQLKYADLLKMEGNAYSQHVKGADYYRYYCLKKDALRGVVEEKYGPTLFLAGSYFNKDEYEDF